MAASGMLHPSVGRFVVDEDCLFLLCSDGLSDNDRVEQFWDTEILPVLAGQTELATAASRLITLGNTQNGHDNVTVGLVYCRVKENKNPEVSPELLLAQLNSVDFAENTEEDLDPSTSSTASTQLLERPRKAGSPLPLFLLLAGLLGLPVLAYFFIPGVKEQLSPLLAMISGSQPQTEPASPAPSAVAVASLEAGELIRIHSSTPESVEGQTQAVALLSKPGQQDIAGSVPAGSVVKVLSKQTTAERLSWLQLMVCWTPPLGRVNSGANQAQPVEKEPVPVNKSAQPRASSSSSQQTPTVKPSGKTAAEPGGAPTGEPVNRPAAQQSLIGWMEEEKVRSLALAIPEPKPEQLGECAQQPAAAPIAPATPTPVPTASAQ